MLISMSVLLIAALGFFTGLRTFTPIAVLCWFAYMHMLLFTGWRNFTASLIAVILFTAAALGEYIGDKLPKTPSRLSAMGLGARAVLGALCGLLLAQPLAFAWPLAILTGAVGGVAGSYIGYFIRTRAVRALRSPDWPVAVVEDIVTIAGSIFTLHIAGTVGAIVSLS